MTAYNAMILSMRQWLPRNISTERDTVHVTMAIRYRRADADTVYATTACRK
jgi:hypothetical protein